MFPRQREKELMQMSPAAEMEGSCSPRQIQLETGKLLFSPQEPEKNGLQSTQLPFQCCEILNPLWENCPAWATVPTNADSDQLIRPSSIRSREVGTARLESTSEGRHHDLRGAGRCYSRRRGRGGVVRKRVGRRGGAARRRRAKGGNGASGASKDWQSAGGEQRGGREEGGVGEEGGEEEGEDFLLHGLHGRPGRVTRALGEGRGADLRGSRRHALRGENEQRTVWRAEKENWRDIQGFLQRVHRGGWRLRGRRLGGQAVPRVQAGHQLGAENEGRDGSLRARRLPGKGEDRRELLHQIIWGQVSDCRAGAAGGLPFGPSRPGNRCSNLILYYTEARAFSAQYIPFLLGRFILSLQEAATSA